MPCKDAAYEGVRVRVQGSLGKARISLQVDIGFGDVIVPGPIKVAYPAVLDFSAPQLKGYTMESTIAEKFQAMVKLGILNSRMKDFYDVWLLSHLFDFKGEMLSEALEKTFENRNTPIPITPTVFTPTFVKSVHDEVHGRIYEISESDEEKLDKCEGVDSGLYYKEMVLVEAPEQRINCLVYIDPVEEEGSSRQEYIKRINAGLNDAQLPVEYVNRHIRKFLPV